MTLDNDIPDGFPAYDHAKDFYARYDVKEILGRGVSSTVRRCREKATGKDYAVKVCDLTTSVNGGGDAHNVVETAKNEVNILRMCSQQKHIVGIQEAFDSNTYMFVILELCPKGELFDYLTEVVALNEKHTRQLMVQLFQAIEFLHSRNIVHRDIKPENILLASDMSIKLSDFGFAAVVEHDEQLTELLGTPGYLSPEVLKVSMYDNMPGYGRPVDLWACGVIMYTVLAGFPPFWHRKQVYMLRAITEGKYSFTSPEWDDISTQAKDLITKLLVVDPKQRLTASEALAHPFCRRDDEVIMRRLSISTANKKSFLKTKKISFKVGVWIVIAVHRLNQVHLRPVDARLSTIRGDPYRFRLARKVIDAAAFKMYGHWVQRSNDQNRAALFSNAIKRDVVNSCNAATAVRMANGGIDVSSEACADIANNATASVLGIVRSQTSLNNLVTHAAGVSAV